MAVKRAAGRKRTTEGGSAAPAEPPAGASRPASQSDSRLQRVDTRALGRYEPASRGALGSRPIAPSLRPVLLPLGVGLGLGLVLAGALFRPRFKFSNNGRIVPVLTTVVVNNAPARGWHDAVIGGLVGRELSRLVAGLMPGGSRPLPRS
jgi:hypothetical protein